jgi:hypothetical protein
MDSEAAVIRAEMSQTRADLDRKLALLEAKAREFTPKQLSDRYMPEYVVDQAIGGLLVLVGLKMAWSHYHSRRARREDIRAALAAYGRW